MYTIEDLDPKDLVPFDPYFRILYNRINSIYPIIDTYVYVAKNLYPIAHDDDQDYYYFQDAESFEKHGIFLELPDTKNQQTTTIQEMEAIMKKELTKGELDFVRQAGVLAVMGVIFIIMGILGLLFGAYCMLFVEKSSALDLSLTALCFGITSLGWLLYKACRIIHKLTLGANV